MVNGLLHFMIVSKFKRFNILSGCEEASIFRPVFFLPSEYKYDLAKSAQLDNESMARNNSDVEAFSRRWYLLNNSNLRIDLDTDWSPVVRGKDLNFTLFDYPSIHVPRKQMPTWQFAVKQLFDIIGALAGLLLTSPLFLFLGIAIKLTTKGPVFYSHERVGKNGKFFTIYKFRSMYVNAEPNGPRLAVENDCRITPLGRFMRRFKLDEIPNFYNVLKGDMSLVGPRPERKFYVDKIVKRRPEYRCLQKVKPGVTSWGQVKFGYAKNVDEMLLRMRYDILYLDNMSLFVDFQILFRTVLAVVRGDKK